MGKAQRAPLGARVLLVPQRGGERTHTPSGASETTSNRCQARRAFDDGGGCLSKRQIVKTKPESQWIVITRPLYHLQQPVSYSSRLQVIHRPGSGNCDRSRLMQYGCAWLPPRGNRFPSGRDSNLEAFSYNPAHGSFAASPFPAAAIPMMRIGGSSRTEPNYRRKTDSSRVKLTCLTTV